MIRWFRSKESAPWESVLRARELEQLAVYNAERARGIVHTEAWTVEMAELQRRFDWAMRPGQRVSWIPQLMCTCGKFDGDHLVFPEPHPCRRAPDLFEWKT